MSERYTRLFTLPANLYSEGAPVIIVAGALLKDNKTSKIIAQLKIKNIGKKIIKAATVQLTAKNTVGTLLGDKPQHQFLDLHVWREECFGSKSAIEFSDLTTRAYDVKVTEVVFEDNAIWSSDNVWTELTTSVTLESVIKDKELLAQYLLENGNDCIFVANEEKDLWICTCGATNRKDEYDCHRCKRKRSDFRAVNIDALKESNKKRIEQNTEQKKKQKKIIIVSVIAAILVAFLVSFFIPCRKEESIIYKPVYDDKLNASIEMMILDHYDLYNIYGIKIGEKKAE